MTQQLQRLADTLTESAGAALERRTSRRNLLVRMTVVGSALSLAPLKYLLRPGSAWAFSTTCSSCSSGICITSHNSAFCCTITGVNHCPSGTTACGWWRCCISTLYCSTGYRYFIDCCGGCGAGHCVNDSCNNRKTCCYGKEWDNCSGTGTIQCRAVLCVNPSQVYSACSSSPIRTSSTCCQGSSGSGCPNHPSCCDTCSAC
ncbi:MAG: hypothetical protein E6G22_10780 [Actinobacteria bacterium]|nr:MAG: hypothetical protein E6G22_10780 [Actinomycetota bacterium]